MAPDNIATDDEMMQCTLHPTSSIGGSGGICAFCLQDKLGKLVSNSSFLPNSPSSSASASASSFRSRPTSASTSTSMTDTAFRFRSDNPPLSLLTNKVKSRSNNAFSLSRSKSTTHYNNDYSYSTPGGTAKGRRGFWSFLHLPHKKTPTVRPALTQLPAAVPTAVQLVVVEEETETSPSHNNNNSNETMSFDRKVTRSRSVGCGSRSFSGDIFGRISTGFGDCALRRVESHRHSTSTAMREREKPRCGGLFGGFMMIASSSSSTSTSTASNSNSSSYWDRPQPLGPQSGRTRGWGWALASPRRVFGAKSGGIAKKEIGNGGNASENSKKTTTTTTSTNLDDIPSLLSVRN